MGYLTPASLITALKDVYDILGLLSSNDHHQDAMRLFAKMKKDRHCRYSRDGSGQFLTTHVAWDSVYFLDCTLGQAKIDSD